MAKKDYPNWSKEELVRELKKVEKRKKYGIVWEDKPEQVALLCKEKLPVLIEEKSKEIVTDKEKPNHILIEGDNYHSLTVLNYTHKGKIDADDFEKKVHKAKAVLINSPSNPTGRIQDIKTLKFIEKVTEDLDIPLLSDEVYKDMIYERENYMLSGPHVVTINSFSKTFDMCGARVGYLYSNDKSIVDEAVRLKTYTSMNTNILAQRMAYHATKVPRKFVDEQVKIWKQRRDLIYDGMCKLGLDVWKPEGAFYILPKIKNPRKFVWDMFKKHKVITYLGEWFGANDRVRFSYALDVSKIEEGLKRVGKYLKKG